MIVELKIENKLTIWHQGAELEKVIWYLLDVNFFITTGYHVLPNFKIPFN
jgi:hypothetical protein